VKGGYDAVLIVKRMVSEKEVRVVYLTSAFAKWYIEESCWETTARFVRRDGRMVLRIPYDPAHTHIECWFEGKDFKGIIYGRFMLSRIKWMPLP